MKTSPLLIPVIAAFATNVVASSSAASAIVLPHGRRPANAVASRPRPSLPLVALSSGFNINDVLSQAKQAADEADEVLSSSPRRRNKKSPPPPPPPPPAVKLGFGEKLQKLVALKAQEAAKGVQDAAARKAQETADYIVSEVKAAPSKVADAAARKAQEAGAYLVSEAKATPGRIGDAAVRKAKETGEYVVSEAKATPGRVAESIEKKAKETIDEITTAPKKILDEIKGVANGPSKKDK